MSEAAAATGTSNNTTTKAKTTASSSSTRSSSNANSRPIHPAVLTSFGPGKGSGASELSVWAYLTRPRPSSSSSSGGGSHDSGGNGDNNNNNAPLPNLVTAQSNSLRVYTVLPNAGTLALTAVYDNLAGSICSLDVIPNGTAAGGGGVENSADGDKNDGNDDNNGDGDDLGGLNEIFADGNGSENNNDGTNGNGKVSCNQNNYDGLLLGFAGHPRLSLVYPSTPMVGSGCWSSTSSSSSTDDKTNSNGNNDGSSLTSGVGQGGVLLASSIIDLTPALVEKSMGGTSYLEQDMIVTVSTSGTVAGGADLGLSGDSSGSSGGNSGNANGDDDPCVSVVLGGGVAIASFSLPKGPRPDEGTSSSSSNNSSSSSSSSWWRVASEPYVLPLSSLAAKIRDLGSGSSGSSSGANPSAANAPANAPGGRGGGRNQQTANAASTVGGGPMVSHGFGDIVDVSFLSGYTEPTLLILHSNPKKGGGRVWPGRLGRTAEVPVARTDASEEKDGEDDEMETGEDDGEGAGPKCVDTMSTGSKYGLTLTAISLSIHQHRSVVLWSLVDSLPVDAWTLVPHPTDGVLVWGVNTVVYVSMGGRTRCALAANGFAKIGCPSGLLPPPPSAGSTSSTSSSSVHLEGNPSPLPNLAVQLDGSRVSFATKNVALVCLTNGSLYSLELHNNRPNSNNKMFMSLFPLGHKVGGLGLASCLSVLALKCHAGGIGRYLAEEAVDAENNAKNVAKKEDDNNGGADAVLSKANNGKQSSPPRGPAVQARGLVFVGSRMGDCTLLAFSMNERIRLVVTDVDAEDDNDNNNNNNGDEHNKRKVLPDSLGSMSAMMGEPKRKQLKMEGEEGVVEILDDAAADGAGDNGNGSDAALTEEEVLRLEEEELYRVDDDDGEDVANGAADPTLVSSSDEDGNELGEGTSDQDDDGYGTPFSTPRRRRRMASHLSMFRSIRALDSLTGLGPLGAGIYGPVATCPSLTSSSGDDTSIVAMAEPQQAPSASSMFSTAFSAAARHYIMPCGYGASGGLAILTTPGRDTVGGTIMCESDLCNVGGNDKGAIFGLPNSNLVLLGKSDGVGCIVMRGMVREESDDDGGQQQQLGGGGGYVEAFEELDVAQGAKEGGDSSMDVDGANAGNVSDVLGKMTLLAASEFCYTKSHYFSVFLVQDPQLEGSGDPYSIVIMSSSDDEDNDKNVAESTEIGLRVRHVHPLKNGENNSFFNDENNARGTLSSITPMVSNASDKDDGSTVISSITFGCVWKSGNASVFNILLSPIAESNYENNITSSSLPAEFKVSESIFVGDDNKEEAGFYDSNKIVGMDVVSLPSHIFDSPSSALTEPEELPITTSSNSVPKPEQSSTLSFPPDRVSMHGTWCAKLEDVHSNGEPQSAASSENRILLAICRRSGLLQIYDNEDALASPLIEFSSLASSSLLGGSPTVPIWQANGCSHGTAILGQSSSPGVNIRRPQLHEVEAAEIRFFVTGPSLLQSENNDSSTIDTEKDSWMLRSLCILVDTSAGDLHLYSGSKRRSNMNRLEFSRVPFSNVTRPSDEAGRHLIKLRRKRIIPSSQQQIVEGQFRPNRLHRFCGISGEDGLFAATPRPLWFASERGAPTVVSHKSRHVAPAGGRPVPVSGFCTAMPSVFQNAKNGFITIHERIGRVGSQRLTLYNGLWDVFAPHGLLPGGGIAIQKVPLGVTVRHIEFIDDASISTTSRPVYAMLVSHEVEADQSYLNDDGLSPEERQRMRDEKEAARVRKQVEADLGGFDMEQEWVEEIEREECFTVDTDLGLAPPMPARRYEVWLVDASSQWKVLDKYPLKESEHGTALKVMYLTDVVEDSDETPERNLIIGVGTSVIDHDGEDLASKGRILLFQVKKSKKRNAGKGKAKNPPLELMLKSEKDMALGPVTSLSSLKSEDVYRIVVGAGAEVTVEQWGSGKLTQVGFYHAHMQVQEIVLFKTFFLLSDAYDSLHFLVWRESDKSLTLLAKDYEPTHLFATGLISRGGAMSFVCHDDRQNLSFLQYAPTDAAARGGNKLVCRADFHMGSQTTSLRSHWSQSSLLFNSCTTTSTLAALKQQDTLFGRLEDDNRFSVNFGTSDGSLGSIVPLSEPTYWRLTALQSVMSNALESNCALSRSAWRLYRRSTRRAGCRSNDRKKGVIDGDIVMKFIDLPLPEQEDLASSIGSTVGLVMDNLLELGCAASVI